MEKEQEHISIIAGCRNGERRAQEQLYKTYYKAMVSICLWYTKNENDAVDVLNRGFLKVFQQIKRYESTQASLYTWIRTLVINSCLDFIKARQKEERPTTLEEADDVHISPEVLQQFRLKDLMQMVRRLPPATGAVFNLYVQEGYSHAEISQLLNISTGTSKWHLSEARNALQSMIQTKGITTNE